MAQLLLTHGADPALARQPTPRDQPVTPREIALTWGHDGIAGLVGDEMARIAARATLAKQERKASLRPKENVPVLQFSKALPHPKDMADAAKSEAGVKFDPETGEPTQIVTTAGEVSTFEGGINVGAEVSAVFESPRVDS